MVFSDSLTKAGRLVELQYVFARNAGRPYSTTELARRLGVTPRNVRRYIAELSERGRLPLVHERRGWRLAPGARLELLPIHLELGQAAALYLAARLLLAAADEPNHAVREAVAALASVMPREIRPFLDRLSSAAGPRDGPFADVFRVVAYGWALSQRLRLSYEPRSHPGTRVEGRLDPYLIEASAIGRAVYVIGRLDPPGELRVLKLERIRSAELTSESFEAPPPGEMLARLDAAWGVWLSEAPPIELLLRFDPAVAPRVRETRWHPSQRLEPQPDGALLMHIAVASVVEILPWLLGWGAHCEVLEPAAVRRQVGEEAARAAAQYAHDGRPPRRGR